MNFSGFSLKFTAHFTGVQDVILVCSGRHENDIKKICYKLIIVSPKKVIF